MVDDLQLTILEAAGWTPVQLVQLKRLRESNQRTPLEMTREARYLHWWRWLVASRRFHPQAQPGGTKDPERLG
jgi:hypothetical protein